MARKTNTTSKSSDFVQATVWGNLSLVTKSGEVKPLSRGIPLDTSEGDLEKLLAQLPHGTELTLKMRVTHIGQKSTLSLDDLI